jgi:hypothetical protein
MNRDGGLTTPELPLRAYCLGFCGANIIDADDPGAWTVIDDGHGYMLMWRDAEPQPVERADTQLAPIIFDDRLDFGHQIVEPVGSRLPGRADHHRLAVSLGGQAVVAIRVGNPSGCLCPSTLGAAGWPGTGGPWKWQPPVPVSP